MNWKASCRQEICFEEGMPGDRCIVCGNSKAKDASICLHWFPAGEIKWIEAMGLSESSVKQHSRICSRHFRNGDPVNGPDKSLGKKFASPKKLWSKKGLKGLSNGVSLDHNLIASQFRQPDSPANLPPQLLAWLQQVQVQLQLCLQLQAVASLIAHF